MIFKKSILYNKEISEMRQSTSIRITIDYNKSGLETEMSEWLLPIMPTTTFVISIIRGTLSVVTDQVLNVA